MGVAENQTYGGQPPSAVASQPTSRKRKADAGPSSSKQTYGGAEVVDLTADSPPKKRKKQLLDEQNAASLPKKRKKQAVDEEKRLRRWRKKAPQSYAEIRDRALTQRMYVLDRQRNDAYPDHPIETISLAGTTGNVYSITIDKVPSCNCPHAMKGNQCKHIIYVLARVLRVTGEMEYQLAFISSELREIFERAPPLPSEQAEQSAKDGNRKDVEGECPICCVDFEPEDGGEEVVFCKASCGNNIHKHCFQQWAATKKGGNVTCPFCRTPWQGDDSDLKKVARSGEVNEEGYVNVANQLGLSGDRDYSTYHPYWVRKQFGGDWY
ncbi:uncharacterized protein LTR77_000800 [Saxophila tyrrhenica]|uniref:Uncharacterized protein n=1 Tax=Saxophila tyrrhenica TaxID=1690608 RepID=A0AAV9PNT1_9PEZI|nr:hypothetical protein LTR77_000800 [Saxophila tyrrhenica]